MRFLSICSGIEAASVAFGPLGWEAGAFSEIDPACCDLLAHHYPDVPNLGDMTASDFIERAKQYGPYDLICGGTPCQAFSVAGKREGLNDDRGNLTLRFVEICDAIGPDVILWENVPGVLSDKTNAFGCLLAGLVGCDTALPVNPEYGWTDAGMVTGPERAAAWRILDAQYFGLAQRRRRVFVVACRTGTRLDPGAILFEPESVRRHTAPSREAGEGTTYDVAPSIGASGRGFSRAGETRGQDCVSPEKGRFMAVLEPQIVQEDKQNGCCLRDTAGSLRADAPGHQPCGSLVMEPIVYESHPPVAYSEPVAFSCKDNGRDAVEDLSPTLRSMNNMGSHANGGGQVAVAFTQNTRDEVRQIGGDGQIVGALPAQPGMKQQTYVAFTQNQAGDVLTGDVCPAMGTNQNATGRNTPKVMAYDMRGNGDGETVNTLTGDHLNRPTDYTPCVTTNMEVRRLTPRECERLQGFPDDYTLVPRGRGKVSITIECEYKCTCGEVFWDCVTGIYVECPHCGNKFDLDIINPETGAPHINPTGNERQEEYKTGEKLMADGPRFKMLGNSWAVPVVRWIAYRIDKVRREVNARNY